MDRNTILDHLARARRHVADAERHIAHQREIIALKERDGHDPSQSMKLLAQFEEIYRLHLQDRDRLEKELDVSSE
jgi:hypothetical protein